MLECAGAVVFFAHKPWPAVEDAVRRFVSDGWASREGLAWAWPAHAQRVHQPSGSHPHAHQTSRSAEPARIRAASHALIKKCPPDQELPTWQEVPT